MRSLFCCCCCCYCYCFHRIEFGGLKLYANRYTSKLCCSSSKLKIHTNHDLQRTNNPKPDLPFESVLSWIPWCLVEIDLNSKVGETNKNFLVLMIIIVELFFKMTFIFFFSCKQKKNKIKPILRKQIMTKFV